MRCARGDERGRSRSEAQRASRFARPERAVSKAAAGGAQDVQSAGSIPLASMIDRIVPRGRTRPRWYGTMTCSPLALLRHFWWLPDAPARKNPLRRKTEITLIGSEPGSPSFTQLLSQPAWRSGVGRIHPGTGRAGLLPQFRAVPLLPSLRRRCSLAVRDRLQTSFRSRDRIRALRETSWSQYRSSFARSSKSEWRCARDWQWAHVTTAHSSGRDAEFSPSGA